MDEEEDLDDITMSQTINDEQKDENMDMEDDDDADFNDGSEEDDWGDDADNDGWGDDGDDIVLGGDDAIQAGKTVESIKIAIPQRTVHDIHSNVDEINMLPMFAAAADLKSRSRIGAIVAIKVDRLTNITQDQLEVWGLTPEYPYIALVFEFGVSYLHELQPPKMKCGICSELSASADLKPFRLSWTIKERCNNTLLNTNHWPCDIQEQNIAIPDANKIAELMESSQQEYALVWEALQKCHNSVDEALNLMLDESNVKKLRKRLPSITVCNAEFLEIMSKVSTKSDADHALHMKDNWRQNYNDADIISQIEHISQMFGMSSTAAALIIQDVGYDTAVAHLEDPEVVQNYITRVENGEQPNTNNNNNNDRNMFGKVWKTITGNKSSNNSEEDLKISEIEDMQSLVRISSSGGKIRQILSENVMRSIVVMSRHNFLLRVVCYALKILLNGNKYCMICDKELVFAGLKVN